MDKAKNLTWSSIPFAMSSAGGAAPEERLHTHYQALLDVTQYLTQTSDFNDLLQFILDKMLDVSAAQVGVTALVYEDASVQVIGGRDDDRAAMDPDRITLSQAVVQQLFETSDLLFVPAVNNHSTLRNDPILAEQQVKAIIVVPMFQRKSMQGFIYFTSGIPMPWIDDLDLETLKGMAAHLSLVIDDYIALDEITRLNESLEPTVQERTTQLAQANQWLAERLQQAEQALAAQEALEQQRTRYFAALAHEMRSPIQLLVGHTYMLNLEGMDRLTETQQKSIDVIQKTSDHLRDVVANVLDAGRLIEDAMPINPEALTLRPLVDETLTMCADLVSGKAVQLRNNLPADLPQALGDVTRVRQILLNLLVNACRHTERGTITVSAKVDDSYIAVSVADTGAGIPADKLDLIFEPYVQADTVRAHTGAGLGLTISKQLVERHGGQIWVKSTEGKGSTFFFTLPVVLS